jgi:hypothetical protein
MLTLLQSAFCLALPTVPSSTTAGHHVGWQVPTTNFERKTQAPWNVTHPNSVVVEPSWGLKWQLFSIATYPSVSARQACNKVGALSRLPSLIFYNRVLARLRHCGPPNAATPPDCWGNLTTLHLSVTMEVDVCRWSSAGAKQRVTFILPPRNRQKSTVHRFGLNTEFHFSHNNNLCIIWS